MEFQKKYKKSKTSKARKFIENRIIDIEKEFKKIKKNESLISKEWFECNWTF